jgi:hypothetical protein
MDEANQPITEILSWMLNGVVVASLTLAAISNMGLAYQ